MILAVEKGSSWLPVVAAIGGAAVGGVVAFLGAWLQERRRWAREDRLRWDPARLNAFSRFLEAARLTEERIMVSIPAALDYLWLEILKDGAEGILQTIEERQRLAIEASSAMGRDPSGEREIAEQRLRHGRDAIATVEKELEQRTQAFENAVDSFTKAAAEIDLIASNPTVEAGEEVRKIVKLMVELARNRQPSYFQEGLGGLRRDLDEALVRFEARARNDLST